MSLTNKQKAFIEHYLETWNATEAARRAGYKGNDNTLGVVGFENLRKPKIAEFIKKRLSEKVMSADEVLSRFSDVARSDIGDLVPPEGFRPTLAYAIEQGLSHLIKSVTDTKYGQRLELYDSMAAKIQIKRHHEWAAERQEESDWRVELAALLREGRVTPEVVIDEFGPIRAQEFFKSVGVVVVAGREEAMEDSGQSYAHSGNNGATPRSD